MLERLQNRVVLGGRELLPGVLAVRLTLAPGRAHLTLAGGGEVDDFFPHAGGVGRSGSAGFALNRALATPLPE